MGKRQIRVSILKQSDQSTILPVRSPIQQNERSPATGDISQGGIRLARIQDGVLPANVLALQRVVGNRALQRQDRILQLEPPKQGQAPKPQKPPPNGAIAEGGRLNDATITAVKTALKQAKIKRYIAYKDIVKVGGTLAWRANNPGSLRDAPTKIARVAGAVGKFAVFATMADGRAAQRDLYLKSYGDQTVRAAVAKLTPPEENDTKQYLKDLVAQGVKLDETVKSQIDKIMEAIEKNEGMIEGIEVGRVPDPK